MREEKLTVEEQAKEDAYYRNRKVQAKKDNLNTINNMNISGTEKQYLYMANACGNLNEFMVVKEGSDKMILMKDLKVGKRKDA